MKRIGLFRYHNNPEFCKNRIELFHHYNPETPAYGLFGGNEQAFPAYSEMLKGHLAGNYCLKNVSDEWKWKNGDLAFRLWYKDYGHRLGFDVVHILEWDLVMFDTLDNLYGHIPDNAAAVTGLTRLKKVFKKWFWTRDLKQRQEWDQLNRYIHSHFGNSMTPYASVGPGLVLPRSFLEQYTQFPVPDWSNDELRIPLFLQSLGFEIYDTGFYKKWFSEREWKYFNCNGFDISWSVIKKELNKKGGRRVFHPYRQMISIPEIAKKEKVHRHDA
jgi:hypothetical protein